MKAWIYGILGALPGIIRKPGTWIIDRIWGVFSDGLRFARHIKDGAQRYVGGYKNLVRGIRDSLVDAYYTVKWVIVTEIPRRVKKGVEDAIRWAQSNLNWLRQRLEAAIKTLDRWATNAINTLQSWAQKAVKWLTDNVNSLLSSTKKLLDRVFNLWSTPLRLAEWLVGAMWTVSLRYLYSHRDRIAQWFLRSSVTFTQWLARELERVLVRLL